VVRFRVRGTLGQRSAREKKGKVKKREKKSAGLGKKVRGGV